MSELDNLITIMDRLKIDGHRIQTFKNMLSQSEDIGEGIITIAHALEKQNERILKLENEIQLILKIINELQADNEPPAPDQIEVIGVGNNDKKTD